MSHYWPIILCIPTGYCFVEDGCCKWEKPQCLQQRLLMFPQYSMEHPNLWYLFFKALFIVPLWSQAVQIFRTSLMSNTVRVQLLGNAPILGTAGLWTASKVPDVQRIKTTLSIIPTVYTPNVKLSFIVNHFLNTRFPPFFPTIKGSKEVSSVYMTED